MTFGIVIVEEKPITLIFPNRFALLHADKRAMIPQCCNALRHRSRSQPNKYALINPGCNNRNCHRLARVHMRLMLQVSSYFPE